MEFRGEFLHAFVNTERVRSHQPVVLIRGNDRFTADSLDYDNLDRVGCSCTAGCAARWCRIAEALHRRLARPLVFITGASSGIGQALAARYHQAGWRLALVARRSGEIQAWAARERLDPARYAVYAADVARHRQHRGRGPRTAWRSRACPMW